MTVEELIGELKKFPKYFTVITREKTYEYFEVTSIQPADGARILLKSTLKNV